MSGFGTSTFGTGPFGLGSPEYASRTSGQLVSSRKFDANGNPVQTTDGTGAFQGMSDALARARIALLRSRPRTSIITASYATDERKRVTNALQFLVDEGVIEIESISSETLKSTASTHVKVRDLTNGRVETIDASPRFY